MVTDRSLCGIEIHSIVVECEGYLTLANDDILNYVMKIMIIFIHALPAEAVVF
jgi:hypothetical protein